MVKTAPNTENVFNISQPLRYFCHLHLYHSRLSRLYLRVFKDRRQTPSFYLLFTDVGYLDCPINWQGANFCTATHDACLALMVEAGLIDEAVLTLPGAQEALLGATRLYIAQTPHRTVRIIAGGAQLLQQLPPELA